MKYILSLFCLLFGLAARAETITTFFTENDQRVTLEGTIFPPDNIMDWWRFYDLKISFDSSPNEKLPIILTRGSRGFEDFICQRFAGRRLNSGRGKLSENDPVYFVDHGTSANQHLINIKEGVAKDSPDFVANEHFVWLKMIYCK